MANIKYKYAEQTKIITTLKYSRPIIFFASSHLAVQYMEKDTTNIKIKP